MDNLKEALEYAVELGIDAEKPEVVEICGRTYANKGLVRFDKPDYADAVRASTLTALTDYIGSCASEFRGDMLIHIVSPTKVRLVSALDAERNREVLFETIAEVSEFNFGSWYDQESFMINLQANFQSNDDLDLVMKLAGNIERKNDQTFSDDGRTQTATMNIGIASKADVIVPNPVTLFPYRTFQEVEQPDSKFVFRIGDKEVPAFKTVEAEGGIWKNEAVANIKEFLVDRIHGMVPAIRDHITIIG